MCAYTPDDDPRITRTKAALCGALVSLMNEKPVDSISVKDIIGRAGLARSTFYLYYLDKYDFIDKTIDSVLGQYERSVEQYDELSYSDSIIKRGEGMFQYIADNADFYRVMLGNNGVPAFRNKMAEIGRKYFYLRYYQLAVGGLSDEEKLLRANEFSVMADYIVAGKIGAVCDWLNSGCKLSSSYMAHTTSEFAYKLLHDWIT